MSEEYTPYIDILSATDWQRSNATKFKAWLQKEQNWYDANHFDFWESWLDDIFDLRTCNDFGLSVWSIILNEPTYGVTEASDTDYPAWGFGVDRENFNNGNFGTNADSGYNFTTEERRILLRLKAFVLHMSGAVSGSDVLSINKALANVLGSGEITCIDNRDMSFTYLIYDDDLSGLAVELYNRDLLPRPLGIELTAINANAETFGFGANNFNFNNGNFAGVIVGD